MQAGDSARQPIPSRGKGAATDDGSAWERRLFQRIDDHGPLSRCLVGKISALPKMTRQSAVVY